MIDDKILIEIRKAGFINKGAELMLLSIVSKLRSTLPEIELAMETGYSSAPYKNRAMYGFYQKAQFLKMGFQFGKFFNFVPKKVRQQLGIVLDKEIDVVIDAAGFAYGDQWGPSKAEVLASACKQWKNNGTKIILMPQAFGPFSSRRIKNAISEIAKYADLIIARESQSYDYLLDAVGKKPNLICYPDFTNLLEPINKNSHRDLSNKTICIVPNKQILEMTNQKYDDYISKLVTLADFLNNHSYNPVILVHEHGPDESIALNINKRLSNKIPIIFEESPRAIKGIINNSMAVIGSRFHALVSALSQGVPAFAFGWSHKYKQLFLDYDFEEGIIDLNQISDACIEIHKLLSNDLARKDLIDRLEKKSAFQKQMSIEMWDKVIEVIKFD